MWWPFKRKRKIDVDEFIKELNYEEVSTDKNVRMRYRNLHQYDTIQVGDEWFTANLDYCGWVEVKDGSGFIGLEYKPKQFKLMRRKCIHKG